MSTFQIIGISLSVIGLFVALLRIVRAVRPRWSNLLGAVVALAAGVAFYAPELTTAVAQLLGIGRGADLLLYAVVIAFVASWFSLYARYRRLESSLTVLVRKLAVRDALDAAARPGTGIRERDENGGPADERTPQVRAE